MLVVDLSSPSFSSPLIVLLLAFSSFSAPSYILMLDIWKRSVFLIVMFSPTTHNGSHTTADQFTWWRPWWWSSWQSWWWWRCPPFPCLDPLLLLLLLLLPPSDLAHRYAIFLCSWDVADSRVGQVTTSDLVANMWEDVLIHLAAIIKIWWRWWKWINQTNGSSLTVNCIRKIAIASHLLQGLGNTKDLQNWIKVRRKIQRWV